MSSLLAFTGVQLAMALGLFALCVLLMLIILIQKGRGGGLAAAFGGGGGGGGGAFGAKTGDVFTGITVVLAGVYLLATVVGNYVFRPDLGVVQAATAQPAPGTAPTSGEPTGTPGTMTPVTLPEGAIKLDPNAAATSLGGAVEQAENETAKQDGTEPQAGAKSDEAKAPPAVPDAADAAPDGTADAPPGADPEPEGAGAGPEAGGEDQPATQPGAGEETGGEETGGEQPEQP